MKRAESILEERNRRKSPLPEIGGALHGAMTEGTFAVLEANQGTEAVGKGSGSDNGADRDVLQDMQGVGGKTLHMEGKAVELSGHIVSFPMKKRGTSSFNRQLHLRGTKLSGDISCASNPVGAKRQVRKEALNSVKRAETLARDAMNKAKAVSRNIVMVVKLAAKSIMALFTALFANLSTILYLAVKNAFNGFMFLYL